MSYIIKDNAVNIWARNSNSDTDVSIKTDSSSIYFENGRTLEDEYIKGTMQSNVNIIDTNMEKIAEGTLDSIYESAIMYGKSLVNIVKPHSSFNLKRTTDMGINYDQHWIPLQMRLQPNTKYIFIYNYESSKILDTPPFSSVVLGKLIEDGNIWHERINWGEHKNFKYPLNKLGINSIVFTTSPYSGNLDSIGFIAETNEIDSTISSAMIIPYQDGMENWDIPYFEGICDVKMPILKNIGKNLFKLKEKTIEWDEGYISNNGNNVIIFTPNSNGNASINSTFEFVDNLFIKAGVQLIYSVKRINGGNSDFEGYINNRLELTYEDGTSEIMAIDDFTSSNFNNIIYNTYTLTKNCIKITSKPIMYTVRNLHSPILLEYQLEMSDIITNIESPKSNIIHTSETITLRSLPNGTRDTLNLKNGEYIQYIGKEIYDGTNATGFNISESYPKDGCTTFMRDLPPNCKEMSNMLSNLLPFMSYNHWNDIDECFFSGTVLVFRLKSTKASTIQELKEYLTQNPVTVYYELLEPIITKVVLNQSEPIVKIGTELPNGVCDTYNIITGEHIQRVGKIILDGNENSWCKVITSNYVNTSGFYTTDTKFLAKEFSDRTHGGEVVCDRFPYSEVDLGQINYVLDIEGAYTAFDGNTCIAIKKSKLISDDENGIREWLKEHPTTVYYELKNPVITKKNGLPNTYGIILPNGLTDKYNELTKVYTQNIDTEFVADNGNFFNITQQDNGTRIHYDLKHNRKDHTEILTDDRFTYIEKWSETHEPYSVFIGSGSDIYFIIPIDEGVTTIEQAKKWFKNNPTKLYYQLNTPKKIDISLINVGPILPQGINDTYNPITKEYKKCVQKIIFNGDEDWQNHICLDNNGIPFFYIEVLDLKRQTMLICDKLIARKDTVEDKISDSTTNYGIMITKNEYEIRIKNGATTLEEFKNKLKISPVTVWYELEKPITTVVDIDLSSLYSSNPIAYENGHIILESGYNGPSLLPTLEYSTLVNKLEQIENINKTIIEQENQLSMLEQMLIQNIIKMDYNNTLLKLNLDLDKKDV